MKKKRKKKSVFKAEPVTPKRMRKAIRGTAGNLSEIARKLRCTRGRVDQILNRSQGPEWDRVRKALTDEIESVSDLALETVRKRGMKSRNDDRLAVDTARWWLEKRRADSFGNKKHVTLEGGENPVRVEGGVDPSLLPIELRKQILDVLNKDKDKEKS